MKTRWVISVSIAVNVALVAAIGWTLKPAARPLPGATTVREVQTTQFVTRVETTTPAVSQPETAAFQWSQLVSDDLKVYRDRLRQIGCPERTMRRIILREIHERFEPRRRAVLDGVQRQFWDLALLGGDAMEKACEKPVESLKKEQEELIEEVLGNEKPEPVDATAELARANKRYSWLPEDKREQMASLDQKLNDARQTMYRDAPRSPSGRVPPTPEAKNALKALENEVTAERKKLLTPAEYEEYELRHSPASYWASNLSGFEATEEEWRSVAKLIKQRDDAVRALGEQFKDRPRDEKARADALKKLDDELVSARKETLSPQRAAEVDRGSSAEYHQLRAVLQRYDMDSQLAARAYEIQQTAMTHANEFRKDQSMDPETRRATLEAIRQETERTLAEALGKKAFATYRKYDNGWFNKLGSAGNTK